jgi:hypothetical protein
MPVYHCYFVDQSERLGDVETIDVPDLATAVAAGKRMLADGNRADGLCAIEIWLGIGRIYPQVPA